MYHGFAFHAAWNNEASSQYASTTANSAARKAQSEAKSLKYEVERLLMITEALWSILKEQHGYDDDKLINEVMNIDMRDGKLDGRVTIKDQPLKCPECGRTLSKSRPTCIYCGTAVMQQPFNR